MTSDMFGRALLAEWTKFRTVRSTYWTVIAATAITGALGAGLFAGILQRDGRTGLAGHDPVGNGIWLHGLDLGQVILAVLGVLMATSEYSTGTIRVALAAIPHRFRVVAAKAVGTGVLGLLFGMVLAFVMFAAARPALAGRGLHVSLTDPTALRGVALAGVATAGVALLGLGCGLLIRHTAGALTTLLAVLLGIPIVEPFFPDSWEHVLRYLPAESAWAMFTPSEHWLPLGPAAAVFTGWVVVTLAAASIAFWRRDV